MDQRHKILRKVDEKLRKLRKTGDMIALKRVGDRVVIAYHPEHDAGEVVLDNEKGLAA